MDTGIHYWSSVSSIATFFITATGAAVGLYGYFKYLSDFNKKQKQLECFLKKEKQLGKDMGQRSLLNIVRYVGLTEEEAINISFKSSDIDRKIKKDEEGFAKMLLFEYVGISNVNYKNYTISPQCYCLADSKSWIPRVFLKTTLANTSTYKIVEGTKKYRQKKEAENAGIDLGKDFIDNNSK